MSGKAVRNPALVQAFKRMRPGVSQNSLDNNDFHRIVCPYITVVVERIQAEVARDADYDPTGFLELESMRALLTDLPGWCAAAFEDVALVISQFDEEDDFLLTPANQKGLQDYLTSARFAPFCEALDQDRERVEARLKKAQGVRFFKDCTRDAGLEALAQWTGHLGGRGAEEFDPDDFAHVPSPEAPIKWPLWNELACRARAHGASPSGEGPMVAQAFSSLLSYVYKLQWKVDHLLRESQKTKPSSAGEFEALITKYPFVSQCDDHVAAVPNVPPLMLSRTAQVRTFSLSHAL